MSLLSGLLFDSDGGRLIPSYAVNHGRPYRYYISKNDEAEGGATNTNPWRLPADQIEPVVLAQLADVLEDERRVIAAFRLEDVNAATLKDMLALAKETAAILRSGTPASKRDCLIRLLDRVVIHDDRIETTVRVDGLSSTVANQTASPVVTLVRTLRLKRRGVEMRLIIEGNRAQTHSDDTLIKAVTSAQNWWTMLCEGRAKSVRELAAQIGKDERYVARVLNFAFLAPKIIEAILDGRQPVEFTTDRLLKRIRLPLEWSEQAKVLGF